jgi:hypothetical protein
VLKLDSHAYSPTILLKIVEAGGQLKSFVLAEKMLYCLADVTISARHVATLTEEIGEELRRVRDQRAQDWLHHRRKKPAGPLPQVVAVAVDGGCIQTRVPGQGPGVHEQGWREDKVACLHTLAGPTFESDPQPEPPACFLDPQYVDELVQDLKSHKRLGEEEEASDEAPGGAVPPQKEAATAQFQPAQMPPEAEPAVEQTRAGPDTLEVPVKSAAAQKKKVDWPPKRLVRTCVATQQSSEEFGPLVAQEAYCRGFFAASRRAFLGDGLKYNWTIQRKWFKGFEAIADFIHPLSYLYVTATALSGGQAERWELYKGG